MLAGSINGLLVARLSLPAFVVTLGTLSVFTATSLIVSGAQSTSTDQMPAILSWTGATIDVGPFNVTAGVLIVILMYLGAGFALTRTGWGTHVYAVGGDPEAARLAGIRTRQVLLSAYI